jgi:putative acetyltransferase
MAGFGSISKVGYLDFMYVSKDHQGMGIGTKLYKVLEQFARSNGFSKITSDVSITAKPFFEKQGFNILQQQQVLIDGIELINYKMEIFL